MKGENLFKVFYDTTFWWHTKVEGLIHWTRRCTHQPLPCPQSSGGHVWWGVYSPLKRPFPPADPHVSPAGEFSFHFHLPITRNHCCQWFHLERGAVRKEMKAASPTPFPFWGRKRNCVPRGMKGGLKEQRGSQILRKKTLGTTRFDLYQWICRS